MCGSVYTFVCLLVEARGHFRGVCVCVFIGAHAGGVYTFLCLLIEARKQTP